MASDERSRLRDIVERLPERQLGLACQLLELLTDEGTAQRIRVHNGAHDAPHDRVQEAVASAGQLEGIEASEDGDTSPETLAKLADLTDAELMTLDELLERDQEGARQFWRQRFGEEMPDL